MSFALNDSNQMSLDDSLYTLTEREQRFLEKSWAKPFADILFPAIKEEDFAVLYSDKDSRPNTPVNIIIGAMILKELLDSTDEEVLESLLFDIRYQYALHTSSFKEQPLSDRTLSRFRERCLAYEAEMGVDLIKSCITGLSGKIAEVMGINTKVKRMDSMMIASNIKKLSRLELLYTCVANIVKLLEKNKDDIPSEMEHYCNADDLNKVIYHTRSIDADQRIEIVLSDAAILLKKCIEHYEESNEYQLLLRVIGEQAIQNENGSLVLKEKGDKTLNSSVLQNPADPDATYRYKAGKEYRGYVANLIEDAGEHGSVITDYSYEQNTYSDSQFLKDTVETLGEQQDTLTLVTDGAYGGEENIRAAKEKDIKLVTTDMQGKKPADVYADFKFTDDGKTVLLCAGGQEPVTSRYSASKSNCRITLNKETCSNCPYCEQCNPKFYKTKAALEISIKTVYRAQQLRDMKTSEFKELAKIRNGVESLPSILRRKYHVDEMPVRGKLKTKLFFGFKIAALNFKKLFDFQNSLDLCAPNMVIC